MTNNKQNMQAVIIKIKNFLEMMDVATQICNEKYLF